MSTLMFWNKQNTNQNNQNNDSKNGKRNWLHSPDALLNGHVVYLVKFLGTTTVEQPKGIEVVKDAIRRLQFAQQVKKSDTGNQSKLKKVEITISVDGVAVQEPRATKILHQFPLHNISYCADEKGVKKFFSFIAKNGPQLNSNDIANNTNGVSPSNTGINGHSNGNNELHECFVFVSSKLASDITLTIGQAFDLAYRRYMNENGKTNGGNLSKIQLQNKQLESTVMAYKNRLKELSEIIPKLELDKMLNRLGIRDIYEVPQDKNVDITVNGNTKSVSESSNDEKLLIETANVNSFVPMIPPRNLQNQLNNTFDAFKTGGTGGTGSGNGRKMNELLLNSDSDSDFDPRAEESESDNKITNDLFGFEPSKTFGQQLFTNNNNNTSITNNNTINNNMNNRTTSPPPLLAPPPKAAIPRRTATTTNNGGSQDLFGSTPFNPNTPSIFDGIETDVYEIQATSQVSSTNFQNIYNDNNITSPPPPPTSNYQMPSIQLNSTPFGDNITKLLNDTTTSNAINTNNPFNESGFCDMNESTKFNNTKMLTDLNAFANNSNKLENLLDNCLTLDEDNSTQSSNFQNNPKMNQNSNGFSMTSGVIFNPFGGNNKINSTLLNTRNASNYDALRNSPDLESMQTPYNMISSSPIMVNSNNKLLMSSDKSSASSASCSFDIFQDAATQAFSQFQTDPPKIAYEFSNQMAGSNFGLKQKSNFSGNNKQSLVDEFSLESLDPLRK